MSARVCPWWLGWLLASPIRKLRHDPARILAPHVREGMTVLEPGPGMGFFTLELARPEFVDATKRDQLQANASSTSDAPAASERSLTAGR
jgi:hypothetical protein